MISIIAWSFLLMISFYVYIRIFNLTNVTLPIKIGIIFFAFILTIGIYFIELYVPQLRFVIMVVFAGAFIGKIVKINLALSMTGFILAFGMSYGFWLLASIPVYMLLQNAFIPYSDTIGAILIPIGQFVFIKYLFSIRRLKNGMKFLTDPGAGAVGVFISNIALAAIIIVPHQDISEEIRISFIAAAIISVVGIIAWWRRGLTILYRKTIKERELRELEEENARLQEEVERFSALIHRDNKLIAALYEVGEFSVALTPLQMQIKQMMADRGGTISSAQRKYKALPKTGELLIDGVMKSMLVKATELDIEFDVTLFSSIAELVEQVTSLTLSTLLADLLENAIIATSHNAGFKRIMVGFGYRDGCYELLVQDTGIPFEKSTLEKLGKERASTYLDNGGSGIGYVTIFEILHEHNASLIITEYPPKKFGFVKTIAVRFDGAGTFDIITVTE